MLRNSKLTLVDFWASWCGPCRAENPNVVKAFQAFHDKGFNIISVSLDDNAARWKAAIIKDGMPWYHVSCLKKWDEPVAKQFGVNAVPDNFLLDADGKVIGRGLRGEALYKAVQEKLK
jgi:thiol-disulfide isomerase/thioredoxin